jgi:hypothetical protein
MVEKTGLQSQRNAGQNNSLLRVDLRQVEDIFNQRHIGAVYLPNVLSEQLVENVQAEIYEKLVMPQRFTVARCAEKNGTTQNFSHFYIEPGKHPVTELDSLPAIKALAQAYTYEIYNPMAEFTGQFKPVELVNSITVNRYPEQGGHISYHQDYGYNRNMISVISIKGIGKSSVALSKDGEGEQEPLLVKPGSLYAMRAPFELFMDEDGPPLWRPWHKTEAISGHRYSLLLRHINEEMKVQMDQKTPKY